MSCNVMQYDAMQCNVMQNIAFLIQCNAMWWNII